MLLPYYLRPSCRSSDASLRAWGMLVDSKVTRVTPAAGWLVAYRVAPWHCVGQAEHRPLGASAPKLGSTRLVYGIPTVPGYSTVFTVPC
jgi:hypothetical protein